MKSSVNIGYVVFLSVVAALGGFLFGYDTAVISGTIAKVTAQFNLDTMSQGWYVGCALIGSIVGVLFAGIFHCIPSLYIRGVGSSVSWTLGITLSISGYHWLFRSLSNELSVAYVC